MAYIRKPIFVERGKAIDAIIYKCAVCHHTYVAGEGKESYGLVFCPFCGKKLYEEQPEFEIGDEILVDGYDKQIKGIVVEVYDDKVHYLTLSNESKYGKVHLNSCSQAYAEGTGRKFPEVEELLKLMEELGWWTEMNE